MDNEKKIGYYDDQDDEIDLLELLKDLKRAVLKNIGLIIIVTGIISVLGGIIGFNVYKNSKVAKAIIQLNYDGITKGKSFDGTPFDKDELINDLVLNNIYSKYEINKDINNIVNSKVSIDGIIPDNIKQMAELKAKSGQEFIYNPTMYVVSFKYDDIKISKEILETLLSESLNIYREKYIPSNSIEELSFTEKQVKDYDYYDFIDIFRNKMNQIDDKIKFLKINNIESSKIGGKYGDLVAKINLINDIELDNYITYIREKRLTKNEIFLKMNYADKIKMAEFKKQESQEKIKFLENIIKNYRPSDKQIILGNSQEKINLNNVDEYYSNLINLYKDENIVIVNTDSEIRKYRIYISELKSVSEEDKVYLEKKRIEILNLINSIVADTDNLLKSFYRQRYANLIEIAIPPYIESNKKGLFIILGSMIFGLLVGIIIAFLKELFNKNPKNRTYE